MVLIDGSMQAAVAKNLRMQVENTKLIKFIKTPQRRVWHYCKIPHRVQRVKALAVAQERHYFFELAIRASRDKLIRSNLHDVIK